VTSVNAMNVQHFCSCELIIGGKVNSPCHEDAGTYESALRYLMLIVATVIGM
jgi:hypothetical protein